MFADFAAGGGLAPVIVAALAAKLPALVSGLKAATVAAQGFRAAVTGLMAATVLPLVVSLVAGGAVYAWQRYSANAEAAAERSRAAAAATRELADALKTLPQDMDTSDLGTLEAVAESRRKQAADALEAYAQRNFYVKNEETGKYDGIERQRGYFRENSESGILDEELRQIFRLEAATEELYAAQKQAIETSRAAEEQRAFAAAQAAKVKSIDDEIDALKRLQAQREQERRIAATDVSDRPAALLRSAGFSAAATGANLDSAIAFTEEQMSLAKAGFASDASYEELAAELKNLLELREKYQLASEAADAQSVRAEQSRRAEEQRLALLRAELSGNAQLAEQLREQARLEELIAANKNAGMDEADAERLARERVSLETAQAKANAAGADAGGAQRVGAGTVGTAQASVGGGRSVNIGMSGAISVAREQLSAAKQMLAALNKIVSNTENPAAGAVLA